jgi:hypothetical protein
VGAPTVDGVESLLVDRSAVPPTFDASQSVTVPATTMAEREQTPLVRELGTCALLGAFRDGEAAECLRPNRATSARDRPRRSPFRADAVRGSRCSSRRRSSSTASWPPSPQRSAERRSASDPGLRSPRFRRALGTRWRRSPLCRWRLIETGAGATLAKAVRCDSTSGPHYLRVSGV